MGHYEDYSLKVAKSVLNAGKQIGKTVVKVNEDAIIDCFELLKDGKVPIMFGVKDTDQIERKYLKRLLERKKYVWHTLDAMAEGGRAIDMNLLNPVTGRPMTGSSSAGAINVLNGINDIGIGTDGGGSVLAPALSLNLFSIMAKGMGLKGNTGRSSTDNIDFVPGIGVMSHSLELAEDSIYSMLDIKSIDEHSISPIKVLVCTKGNLQLPDGSDMRTRLDRAIDSLGRAGVEIYEEQFPDFVERKESINWAKEALDKFNMIITCEGPVDLVGLGDSVFGGMGSFTKSLQNKSGKYMVKIANMINATAVTLPIDEAASGIVITAREGLENGRAAVEIAKQLKDLYKLPDLYYSYFKDAYKRRRNDNVFSVKGV